MSAELLERGNDFVRTAKAVILYDHVEAILAANQFVDHVRLKTYEAKEWAVRSWQFDMLKMEGRLEAYRALEEAEDADLVLVTICDPRAAAEVPADWLFNWAHLRRLQGARMIVLLFDRVGEDAAIEQRIRELRQIAAFRDLSFSVQEAAPSNDDAPRNFRTSARREVSLLQKFAFTQCAVPA